MPTTRRWPMCGPPTAAAREPSGFGTTSQQPCSSSAGSSTATALAQAVAVLTARQQGLPVTVSQLVEDADLADVARLLAVVACALLEKHWSDGGAGLLRDLGVIAAEERS